MFTRYKIKGSQYVLMELKERLWRESKITSNMGLGTIVVFIKDAGELTLLQEACNDMGLYYEQM